ncbi:hypothetical protein RclHR1_14690004 [Rhizophagus clarus]|uniref:Protein kinase domain-containing protein n=1 Tax=Rhizophagus clarus TaxID=94130 RepID=A0A2Z6QQN8_9GLOM|nr:hypothetical protein RclHR1_14690004 [Rhizophagus clarus]
MGILTKYFVDFGDLDAGKKIITENFANWTSGNEIIDTFIQKKQLNYDGRGVVFEWIPYSELIDIKEIEDNCLTTAILKGSLCYDRDEKEWIKRSYEKVILRFLYVLHDSITDEIETYLNHKSYGISQNPDTKNYILIFDHNYRDNYCEKCGNRYYNYDKWCKPCHINLLKNNFIHWTSGNEKIDDFIQEIQLKIGRYYDIIFEWIPYNEFIFIKELEKYTIAIWEKGPLYHNINDKKLIRKSCEKVCLKYQHSLQDITNEFLNKVESYLTNKLVFGISQNPETKILILVFSDKYFEKFCEICDNRYESEWNKWCGFDIAIWKDGPLNYIGEKGMMKESYKKVGLKYLYNSQEIANEFLVEIESHLIDKRSYGLSQNPDTKNNDKWCKMCQINHLKNNFPSWTSGNKKIDYLIQKMQLKINKYDDTIFEWIPYNEFINIKQIRNGNSLTAIWKDGPLNYSKIKSKYKRDLSKDILLKYLTNSQNVDHIILNKIVYSIKKSYGLTQDPFTKDFILVLQLKYYCEFCGEMYNNQFEVDNKSCTLCQINCEYQEINDLIQKMRLRIDYNSSKSMVFEWIRYDQFDCIREVGKGGFATVYSAIWKDGLLCLDNKYNNWKRKSNSRVAFKMFVKAYSNQKIENILKIYGISQNPDTKDYIMVLEYAEGGSLISYLHKNLEIFDWFNGLKVLTNIVEVLSKIHQKQMVHRDFHPGNILFINDNACISDMGLCKNIDDINETSVYGVLPYVAPEVLKRKPYTQAADIYSFGMIMYIIATGRLPFADCAHDIILALCICKGIRPKINEFEAPKCYIDLMEKCWDSNPDNRPNAIEIIELINFFSYSLRQKFRKKEQKCHEIEEQFKITQQTRITNLLSIKNNTSNTHKQAIYKSRLLNPFTGNLSDNDTVEIPDLIK